MNPPDDLDQLEARIEAATREADKLDPSRSSSEAVAPQNGMGDAMRLAMDLVISVAIGTGLGLVMDNFLNTKPWFMLVFMIFGVAAGFRNFYLFAGKLLRPNNKEPE